MQLGFEITQRALSAFREEATGRTGIQKDLSQAEEALRVAKAALCDLVSLTDDGYADAALDEAISATRLVLDARSEGLAGFDASARALSERMKSL